MCGSKYLHWTYTCPNSSAADVSAMQRTTGDTILVIDPEPVVRSVITSILERDGHTVLTCANLDEALQAITASPPRLLLTNIYLDGIPGYDAAKPLTERCPALSVLIVAGLPDDQRVYN